jgi:alpha,alpha-trehalase
MVIKTPKFRSKIPRQMPRFKRAKDDLTAQDVAAAREYIAGYWNNLTRVHKKDDDTLLGLPNPYLVPSFDEKNEFDYNEMYYWDSYFMVQGLLDEEHKDLVMGILDNLIYMYKRFGVVPNASRLYLVSRTQPPFLTAFIFDVYNAYKPGKDWLK